MTKKLYKIKANEKVCGVCAGFAEYLNLDVTIVRIVTFILILLSHFSLLIVYFICALIMPDKAQI